MLLDVGCGCGYLLFRLGEIGQSLLFGIDFSKGRLRIAKERRIRNLIAADAQSLPYKQNTFDIVVSTETLEHMLNPTTMLKEIRRILKKGGILILTVPSFHTKFKSVNPLTILRAMLSLYHSSFLPKDNGLLKPYSQKTCDMYDSTREDAVVHRAFSMRQFKTILNELRFSVLKLKTIIFPPVIGRMNPIFLLIEQMIFQRIPVLKDLGNTLLCVSKLESE